MRRLRHLVVAEQAPLDAEELHALTAPLPDRSGGGSDHAGAPGRQQLLFAVRRRRIKGLCDSMALADLRHLVVQVPRTGRTDDDLQHDAE